MNSDTVSADKNTLPQALLPAFKRWARIDACDDDELITEIIQGAIEQFQRNSEITVFASTVSLEPETADYALGSGDVLRLEVTPINTLQVLDATSAPLTGFTLKSRGFHGVRIYSLVGALVDGMTITIETGYTRDNLPPEIRQTVCEIAAHLYEYREIMLPTNVAEPPMWLNQVMAGFWLPRV